MQRTDAPPDESDVSSSNGAIRRLRHLVWIAATLVWIARTLGWV